MLYFVILIALGIIFFLILRVMIKHANNTCFNNVIISLLAMGMLFLFAGAVSCVATSGIMHLIYNERKENAEKEYYSLISEVEAFSKMNDIEKIIYLANGDLSVRITEWNNNIKKEENKNKWDNLLDPNIYKNTDYIDINKYIIFQKEE